MTSQETCALRWGATMERERTTASDEDTELVVRFAGGDAAAFDRLFHKYQDYVYRILYGIVGSAEESRDLTQEVFVQVYRSLPKFRQGAKFATWLYRIAVNRGVDAARASHRWRFLPILEELRWREPAPSEEEPENLFAKGMEREAVQKTLMACPLIHREVLVLRYYNDLSMEEIAETLGCTLSAAKVRLHRARHHFKERYLSANERCDAVGKGKADGTKTVQR